MPQYLLRRCTRYWALVLPVILLLLSSCASQRYYNQRTMFRLTTKSGGQIDSSKLRIAVNRTERNYRIQANDFLQVRVYTNKGERILDPNGELQFGQPGGIGGSQGGGGTSQSSSSITQRGGAASQRNGGQVNGQQSSGEDFLVQADGTVILPMVNRIKLSGLSLLQADSVLQVRYKEYYKEPFVKTRVTNNRIFVLGAPGGQVIPLTNDNMSLIEVLALAGGPDGSSQSGGSNAGFYRYGGKVNNIRIIRGDLKNPRVQQVDLTTLDGMRRANLQMEPNDIVYIEPVHRPAQEALLDAAPIIGLVTVLLNTTLIIINFTK